MKKGGNRRIVEMEEVEKIEASQRLVSLWLEVEEMEKIGSAGTTGSLGSIDITDATAFIHAFRHSLIFSACHSGSFMPPLGDLPSCK